MSTDQEVVRQFFVRLESFDIRHWLELWHEDGRQIMPFSPKGFPRELVGRDAIHNQYKGMPDNFTAMRFPDLRIEPLAKPGEFFVTYRGEIALRAGGTYNNTYAGHFVIRDGKIERFTEYFDPIVLLEAFGGSLQDSFNVR